VPHADVAEETFSSVMGDVVEPRRDFIQANALQVADLDVNRGPKPRPAQKSP
jgi:DNA gyrase subunit B